jgi:BirA family biotin operon repressor/biotin-[acetyl-CoA-carboxylase] ligase
LIENILNGSSWEKAVLGIGININQTQFPEMKRKPVSVKQISGKSHDPIEMAKELCIELEKAISLVVDEQTIELLKQYNQDLYKKDQIVKFSKDNLTIDARVKGVDLNGNLILDGYSSPKLSWGEMEWID